MLNEHMPGYLAGATNDPLMTVVAIILVISVFIIGIIYFKLHAIPEHIAHGKNHAQIQLIAVLTLLALFTHNNIFWVLALVIAVVEVPDFITPLKSIATSLNTIAKQAEVAANHNSSAQEPPASAKIPHIPSADKGE